MRKLMQRGFTLLEIVVGLVVVAWVGFCGWMIILMVRALLKYLGS